MNDLLSKNAQKFLQKTKRRRHISDRSKIERLIQSSGYPVFEVVVDFQVMLGGYVLYAAMAPMVLGIVHPVLSKREFVKARKVHARQDNGTWLFGCVDSLYQMDFEIDQNGIWYQDGEPQAQSPWIVIEREALMDHMGREGEWEEEKIDNDMFTALQNKHKPELIERASDQYLRIWRTSEIVFYERSNDRQKETLVYRKKPREKGPIGKRVKRLLWRIRRQPLSV